MAMRQLSGLDATFLYLETPEMPMHVGALHIFELPPGFTGSWIAALRRHIASRLPVAAVLRRRVWQMPLNLANPAWVDAEPDMKQHIVEVRLPKEARHGDGMRALETEVGRLHAVLLDRRRPLWKMHVLTGLGPAANGNRRIALYTQLHHAAVDGQAAVALANAILDTSPVPRAIELKSSQRRKVYSLEMTEMLRGAIGNQMAQVVSIVKELPETLGTLGGAAKTVIGNSALFGGTRGPSNLTLAPKTPYNVSVTAGRAFGAISLPLRELKLLGKAHEATLNDMVLMLVSTALRRHFAKRRVLPKKSLIAAVPISLRQAGDTTSDNQASMSLISLGTHLADPRKRLDHIKAATKSMKAMMGSVKSILPTDFPSLGVPWLMEAAVSLVGRARVADRIGQVANLVISNVPGPPVTLYLAGAKMITNYPTSICTHGMALNITVQSYDQSLDFGLMADPAAEPDVHGLAQAIAVAYEDLHALPLPHEPDEAAVEPDVVTRTAKAVGDAAGKVAGGAGKVAGKVAGDLAAGFAAGAASKLPKVPGVGEVTRMAKGLVGRTLSSASGAVSKVTGAGRANARKKAPAKG
jgi:WS/DGAT/MGAT family acyltransferase